VAHGSPHCIPKVHSIVCIYVTSMLSACCTWVCVQHRQTSVELTCVPNCSKSGCALALVCPAFQGVLSPEDAKVALKYGIDGIIVSNHGECIWTLSGLHVLL
jgi:hypothetical protein